jgi:hypothetical protein
METAMLPGAVPLDGERASHGPFDAAVQDKLEELALATETTWDDGSGVPNVQVNWSCDLEPAIETAVDDGMNSID